MEIGKQEKTGEREEGDKERGKEIRVWKKSEKGDTENERQGERR